MARKKKQTAAQRNAFWALIAAAVGCVATGLVGLARGGVALGIFNADPGVFTQWFWIFGGLIVAGLLAYAFMAPDNVSRFIGGRQARYGSNALVMGLAFLGILIVLNWLAFRYPYSKDVTEDQTHTLAAETIGALQALPEPVTALAFYSTRLSPDDAVRLLQDFKVNSNGKFDYQFIDPDSNPIAAREAGITGDGKIMLVMGEQREIASYASETELTRSLIRLMTPEQRTLYFLTGHGEPDISGGGERNLSLARSTLESKNYIVKTLNLLDTNVIPEDAQAIIIAGPLKPLSYAEITLLKRYLDGGGGLVVLEDPLPFTEFGDDPDPLATYLDTAWAIQLNDDIIVDQTSAGQELYAIGSAYDPTHPVTQNTTMIAILPNARSLTVGAPAENINSRVIISTSENSWAELEYEDTEGWQYDEGIDLPGPLTLAAAADNSVTSGRVVVFGNSLFATDEAFDAYGNGNVFVNAVDWSAQQDDLIQITPREPIQRQFQIPSAFMQIAIFLGSIFVLPGLVLVAGLSAWFARRRRG